MIAGPNGSGKTTLLRFIRAQAADFQPGGPEVGLYINPDDIATALRGSYEERVREAQSIADDQREFCIDNGLNFTFETVMSHPSKVEFFERARDAGFLTVLYFVSTSSADLNVRRVAERVQGADMTYPKPALETATFGHMGF
jgi:predicted ABC-type ATPase